METIENIKTDEGGCVKEPYLCSENYLTWLIGKNLETNPVSQEEWALLKFTMESGGGIEEWADELFKIDIRKARKSLSVLFPSFIVMPDEVQVILVNMAYNMGTGRFNPKKWPGLFGALAVNDWIKASEEMKNSKWYGQVGRRSKRLVEAMRNINATRNPLF